MNFRPLIVIVLFFCGCSSVDECVKEGEDVAIDGGACAKYKNTLSVEEQSLRVRMDYTSTEDIPERPITLKIGECQIEGRVSYSANVKRFNNAALGNPKLPATFEITDQGIKLGQKSVTSCRPKFIKTTDGRYTIAISYEATNEVKIPGYVITFQDAKIYTGVQPAGEWEANGWRLWVTIGGILLVIAIIASAIIGTVWYYVNKNKKEKDQAQSIDATKDKSKSTSVKSKAKKTKDNRSNSKSNVVNANNRSLNLAPNWVRSFQWNANDYTENGFPRLRAIFEGPNGKKNMRLVLRYHPLNQQQVNGFTNLRFRYCQQVDPEVSGYPTGTAVYLRMKRDISLMNSLLVENAQIAGNRN
ncbi:hypothetical protein M3Y94_00656100 [Aphelenchoides besseyi]|nr:hypothetical protein M3Y94_00656100 [Aphelenchoides besseyi]KAI6231183.1 hypothetical protein M3Y95_00354600 [Aphelenchoides besseyi]